MRDDLIDSFLLFVMEVKPPMNEAERLAIRVKPIDAGKLIRKAKIRRDYLSSPEYLLERVEACIEAINRYIKKEVGLGNTIINNEMLNHSVIRGPDIGKARFSDVMPYVQRYYDLCPGITFSYQLGGTDRSCVYATIKLTEPPSQ